MKRPTAALGLMALAVSLFVSSTVRAAAAAEKSFSGVVVSAGDGKLVVTDKKSGKDISYIVHPTCAVVTETGDKAMLEDLKKGDEVSFQIDTDKKVTSIRRIRR